jgi:hypothetical protein
MSRTITISAGTTEEEIYQYFHDIGGLGGITLLYGTGHTDAATGEFIFDDNQIYREVHISGANYDAMMSGAPSWQPLKPAGTFRIADLFHGIDAVNVGTVLAMGT